MGILKPLLFRNLFIFSALFLRSIRRMYGSGIEVGLTAGYPEHRELLPRCQSSKLEKTVTKQNNLTVFTSVLGIWQNIAKLSCLWDLSRYVKLTFINENSWPLWYYSKGVARLFWSWAKFENYFSLWAALFKISDDKITILWSRKRNWSFWCFYWQLFTKFLVVEDLCCFFS